MSIAVEQPTPRDFSPRTEDEVVAAIHRHPLPTYRGKPKKAHNRIYVANDRLLSGLRIYFMIGRKPGDFLTSVIENSFTQAVGRADNTTLTILDAISTYLSCYPSADAWGSETARKKWQAQDGLVGRHGPEEAWNIFIRQHL